MSLNGSGVFSVNTTGQPVQSGTLITSTAFNALTADIATALTTALYKDGQQVATANQPMGGFKHTNIADAVSRDQYASAGQAQDGGLTYLTSISGTNTIVGSVSPTPSAYAAGQRFSFIVGTTNTGAATLNVSSLGAKSIKKRMSGGAVAIVAADLVANTDAEVFYDGTDFILETARTYSHGANVSSSGTTILDTTTGDLIDVTGTTSITAITLAEGEQRTVRFTDALTLTHGSSLVLPGAANITTAAGDFAVFRGYASGVVRCVTYSKATGYPTSYAPVVQEVEATPYTTYQSTSVTIPTDDSIPQNTEGTEFITATITPRSASNRLVIEFRGMVGADANRTVAAALFQDSTANAIAANAIEVPGVNSVMQIALKYEMAAGTTSATTFKIRVGPGNGSAFVNGNGVSRIYGGVSSLRLRVRELTS